MNKKIVLFFILWIISNPGSFAQSYDLTERVSPDGKFSYQTVTNDPLGVRIYTLENGLTVMLSVNKNEPRVQTIIATKAGSKNDPSDNTGLAHYLEHMLFKGSDLYGTSNWTKEKEQLDKIDALYEIYNKTTNDLQRKEIYHRIDSVSLVASKFAIANEYDKMLATIGAKGTNAFTSLEQTVYVNDIPQNQVESWLTIESERFRNPVLRLFHTELEAVYEEKNISMDDDNNKVFEEVMQGLFTKSAYGTQTTIGTVEHLKNPSLIKIRNYYNTYYVPNNMAIILSGDINPDKTIELIAQKFGSMKSKPVPPYTFGPEPVRTAPLEKTVYGPDAESVTIGFRMPGANAKESEYMVLCDYLLANSKAGFIDLNLVKKQKVLSASSSTWINKDYSIHFLEGKAREGQSLDEVKKLLLDQIALVKKGAFDDVMMKAIISNFKVDKIKTNETNSGRAYTMLDAFIVGKSWEKQVVLLNNLSNITKQELVDFANKFYTNDYVVVYKKTGEAKAANKIEKPQITGVELNREQMSPFVKAIIEKTPAPVKPVFIDYGKDIATSVVSGKVPVYHVKNNENGLFKMYYVFDMGKFNNIKLPLAIELLKYLGTDKYSAEDISKSFFNLACNFNVSSGDEQVYVSVSGLDENFEKTVQLFEHLLANVKPDQAALDQLVSGMLKEREDDKLNKQSIFWNALRSYTTYGKNNPFRYKLSNNDLKALKADELVQLIRSLTSYEHNVYYYGPRDLNGLTSFLAKEHALPAKMLPYPPAVKFTRNASNTNQVYFTNYKMVQAEILWMNRQPTPFDTLSFPIISVFNEYFGGGMSSVVFQTIRESKALAYSTFSRYSIPVKKEDPVYIIAYIGTQADKLNDGVSAMNSLLNEMPVDDKSFKTAIDALKAQIETERITKEQIIFSYFSAKKLGLHHDRRKDVYEGLDKITLNDLIRFHDTNYKDKKFSYAIMGSSEKIKVNDLRNLGTVIQLSLEDIFGY